jgi:type I restriction-modification system DNA methylase subunit
MIYIGIDISSKGFMVHAINEQKTIDQRNEGSRMWKLSIRCIYGTDANDRMARTSKMNMIMHGDGHGWCASPRRIPECKRDF